MGFIWKRLSTGLFSHWVIHWRNVFRNRERNSTKYELAVYFIRNSNWKNSHWELMSSTFVKSDLAYARKKNWTGLLLESRQFDIGKTALRLSLFVTFNYEPRISLNYHKAPTQLCQCQTRNSAQNRTKLSMQIIYVGLPWPETELVVERPGPKLKDGAFLRTERLTCERNDWLANGTTEHQLENLS